MDAVEISEVGKKVFIFNDDLCGIAASLKNYEYDCVPTLIALVALLIINVKLWDWFKFPDNIVEPPFRFLLPCVEAAGQWSLSNMAMTCVIYINNLLHESFKTVQEEKHNKHWFHALKSLFRNKNDDTPINNHFVNAPFLLSLCLSLALLSVSLMIQKKKKVNRKM